MCRCWSLTLCLFSFLSARWSVFCSHVVWESRQGKTMHWKNRCWTLVSPPPSRCRMFWWLICHIFIHIHTYIYVYINYADPSFTCEVSASLWILTPVIPTIFSLKPVEGVLLILSTSVATWLISAQTQCQMLATLLWNKSVYACTGTTLLISFERPQASFLGLKLSLCIPRRPDT